MEKEYFYDAFISYRHLPDDMKIAERLQRLLERLKKRGAVNGKSRPLRVFRDQSELPVSENLSKDIEYALQNSDYLIIICSPQLKDSKWCMKELRIFRELHGNTNTHIIPLLTDGEPEESFPEALRFKTEKTVLPDGSVTETPEEIEPLAADVRAGDISKKLKKLRKTEYLRIAAPILGMRFDDLYQRRKRERNKKLLIGCSCAAVLLAGFLTYFVYSQQRLSTSNIQVRKTNLKALQTEAERVSALAKAENGDPALAYLLAEHAYNMFEDEKDVPEKVRQNFESAAQSYLTGLKNNLLQLRFSDSLTSVVEDNLRVCGGSFLALSDGSKTFLYDISTGERIFSCEGSEVYFSPDASIAASSMVKNSKNVVVFYRTKTGEELGTVENSRRRAASASMNVCWENGVCYAVDFDNCERIFEVSFPENGKAEINEELPQETRDRLLYICGSHDDSNYYLKVFVKGSVAAGMKAIDSYSSQLSEAQKAACDEAAKNGYAVAGIQPGQKFGLLKCTLDNAPKTLIFSEESGDILHSADGRLYYDSETGCCFGLNGESISVYTLNEDYGAICKNRFYSRISPNGRFFFTLSGDSMERYYGGKEPVQMLICDMTQPESSAVALSAPLYTSSKSQTFLCYCDTAMTRVFYVKPDGTLALYDLSARKEVLKWQSDAPENIFAVSMDEDCGTLAVAVGPDRGEYEVCLYSAETGELLQKIDFTGKLGKPRSAYLSHVELYNDLMLVSTGSDSILLKKENGVFNAETALYFSRCGNSSVPWRSSISDDGLLFFAEQEDGIQMTHPRHLSGVFAASDGKQITGIPYSKAFIYEPEKKLLIAEKFVSGNIVDGSAISHAGTISLYKYADGAMEKTGELASDSADMHLSGMCSVDGKYVLLENSDSSEIYDVTTMKKICEISATGLLLSEGRVVNPSLEIPCKDNSYTYSGGKKLQSVVRDAMTRQLGQPRTLTDAEKEKYGIRNP